MVPVLVLLYFQVAFLPRHDAAVTWAHRIYLMADVFLLFTMGTLILFPDHELWSAPFYKLFYNPLLFIAIQGTILGALF